MRFKKILPHVYHLDFDLQYDVTMHFLRYQEYYESTRWHKQIFSLLDYMEWYAKEYGEGAFTYTTDWAGFNVPSEVLLAVAEAELPDPNRYDDQMRSLIEVARQEELGHPFYFIGTSSGEEDGSDEDVEGILDHEIGHALYYTDNEYLAAMEDLLDEMPRKNYDAAWAALQEMGYHPAVCRDEIQAYACTGPCEELEKALPDGVCKPFIKEYKAQRKRIKKAHG